MVEEYFMFDESNSINFKLSLYNMNKEGERTKSILNCFICKKQDTITLYYIYDVNDRSDITSLLLKEYKKKNFSIKDANINGNNITLKIDQPIRFTNFNSENGKHQISMNLKSLSYISSLPTQVSLIYRLSPSANFIEGYLSEFVTKGNVVVGIAPCKYSFSLNKLKFTLFRDNDRVYIQAESEESIEWFIALTSFFSCKAIEIDMLCKGDERKVIAPHYKYQNTEKGNNVLGYLFSHNTCLDYYVTFIEMFSNVIFPVTDVALYIDNYVRAEYMEDVAKLIRYVSIIEKMANVQQKDDSWNCVEKFLNEHHINLSKINTDLDKIKDNDEKPISNFVRLRNFFVHDLGNKAALEYLEESDLLFYLKMVITIIILKMLGVDDIKFDKCFHKISILDDEIKECDTISAILKMHHNTLNG